MIKRLLAGIALTLVLLLLIALKLPVVTTVERSLQIDRPPATVFSLLNGFERFHEWAPLLPRDPQAVFHAEGPVLGVGARFLWHGDPRQVGDGVVEIVESTPFRQVAMILDLGKQGGADMSFELQRDGGATRLHWRVNIDARKANNGISSLVARYLGLLMDAWLGPEMESGLRRFAQMAEAEPSIDFTGVNIEVVDLEPVPILFVSGQTSQDAADVADALGAAFAEVSSFLGRQGFAEGSGAPLAITRAWDERGFLFDAAVPVADIELPPLTGRLRLGTSPAGRAVRLVHRGPYAEILESYRLLAAYMSARGWAESGLSWERYVTNPAQTAPEDAVIEIYVLLPE